MTWLIHQLFLIIKEKGVKATSPKRSSNYQTKIEMNVDKLYNSKPK